MEMSNEATTRIAAFLDAGYENEKLLKMARGGASLGELATEVERLIVREIEYHAAPNSLTNDLAIEALKAVNWQEIAQMFINEAQEETLANFDDSFDPDAFDYAFSGYHC